MNGERERKEFVPLGWFNDDDDIALSKLSVLIPWFLPGVVYLHKSGKWCEHHPEQVLEGHEVTRLWDFTIHVNVSRPQEKKIPFS